jgi:ABC-type dipeptide/oligopeptide/nickel transport system permease component
VVQAIALVLVASVFLINTVTELAQRRFDPRLRHHASLASGPDA